MWDRIHYQKQLPLFEKGRTAAVLAPLFEDDSGEVRLLLTKRPDTMPTHAGHISFPGGRPDPGDEGPVATALRETQEEVGINPEQVDVLGYLEPFDTVEFTLMVVPVVARVSTPLDLVVSEREVARVYTPLLSDLADEDAWWFIPWNEYKVWYFDLEGDSLWGATAMMVRRLLGMGQ
jgi:8-oxo-dGTP pyrophosphatase MutT (NUDIX family)